MFESRASNVVAWGLLLSTVSCLVPEDHTTLFTHNVSDLPCLALLQYGRTLPRCINHSLYESSDQDNKTSNCATGNLTINFTPVETKPGRRFVGSHNSDKYSCYPLSDEDFWRSREAVPGDLRRLAHVNGMAERGLPVRVAVLGGSVTYGGSCASYALPQSKPHDSFGLCCWSYRFVDWLKRRHQNSNIKLFNLAVPATTSAWRLSHFDEVLAVRPDLLIVDYGINDPNMGSTQEQKAQYASMCRAATERLVRRFLEATEVKVGNESSAITQLNPQAAIVYLDVHRSLNNVPDVGTYSFGREVYHPVCRAYGVPVVSIRDAVWPVKESPRPEIWETKAGAHPLWSGHQLIADLLAFTWTLASNRLLWKVTTRLLNHSYATTVPEHQFLATGHLKGAPYLFGSTGGHGKLEVCPGGKYLSTPPSTASGLKPSRLDTQGWQHIDHNGKVGWEYSLANASKQQQRSNNESDDATDSSTSMQRQLRSKSKSSSPKHLGRFPLLERYPPIPELPPTFRDPLPGIISFPGRFKAENPGLLVEYLRSYANYGQAIVFVSESKSQSQGVIASRYARPKEDIFVGPSYAALEVRARALLRLAWINHRFARLCQKVVRHEDIHVPSKRVNYSPDCSMVLAGTWKDPSALDGFWHDESSQVDIDVRRGSLSVENDANVPGRPWKVAEDSSRSLFQLQKVGNVASNSQGGGLRDQQSGVIEGEVHFMMVPWSNLGGSERNKFKIMGVNTC